MARVIPISRARSELTTLIVEVEDHHEHLVLTRNGRPVAKIMSVAEYEALQETLDVLADTGALGDLRASAEDVKAGRVVNWKKGSSSPDR